MRIRNWEKFQHYRRRSPPWIKLHRKLLDNPDWYALDGASAKLLVELWLVASEEDGELPDSTTLAWRLRRSKSEVMNGLKLLFDSGFLVDASTLLAECSHDATPETETEAEKESMVHPDAPTHEWPAKPERNGKGYVYPALFETAWEAYPKRAGPNPKTGAYRAFRARVKAGDDPTDLIASAGNYRKHCVAAGKNGTEFVKQAATFWGPNEPWRDFIEPDDDPDDFARSELDRWNQLVADTQDKDAA